MVQASGFSEVPVHLYQLLSAYIQINIISKRYY